MSRIKHWQQRMNRIEAAGLDISDVYFEVKRKGRKNVAVQLVPGDQMSAFVTDDYDFRLHDPNKAYALVEQRKAEAKHDADLEEDYSWLEPEPEPEPKAAPEVEKKAEPKKGGKA